MENKVCGNCKNWTLCSGAYIGNCSVITDAVKDDINSMTSSKVHSKHTCESFASKVENKINMEPILAAAKINCKQTLKDIEDLKDLEELIIKKIIEKAKEQYSKSVINTIFPVKDYFKGHVEGLFSQLCSNPKKIKVNYVLTFGLEKIKIKSEISEIPKVGDVVKIKGFILQSDFLGYQHFVVKDINTKKEKIKISIQCVIVSEVDV